MPWHPAVPVERLPRGGRALFKHERTRVALFHLDDGRILAVDNACPHEGYPLVQGDRKDCVLTCIWHNYKFDLRDGSALMGEEAVRTFATRVVGDHVHVELPEPGPVDLGPTWSSLHEATQENQPGRMVREAVRLLEGGAAPEDLLSWVAAYDAGHAKWGATHVLPLAEDCRRLLTHVDPALAVLQPLELAGLSHVRRSARDRPEPRSLSVAEIARAVEDEDAALAEAGVRGALADGMDRHELEPLLLGLSAAHFLDFGHQLIYATKVFDLLDGTGASAEQIDAVLGTLVYGVTNGTREDLLPEWAGWRKRMRGVDLDALWSAPMRGGPAWWDRGASLTAVLLGKPADAFNTVHALLEQGVPRADVLDLLVACACHRMLRIDLALEARPDLQHGWLDVTHILTFTAAVRAALERWDDPQALRLVFQAVHFINRYKAVDGPVTPIGPIDASPQALLDAVMARDPARAQAIARGTSDPAGAWDKLLAAALHDGLTAVPIQSAHRVKTWLAAHDESRSLDGEPDWARLPLAACARYLAAPRQERRLQQRLHEARRLILNGDVPQTLC
jgi:nitrite reductase/ring-hydroxylating ferredoxin subunit